MGIREQMESIYGVGARLLVLRGFLAYSSFREPRA